jgi:hypothetical protein
MKAKRTAAKVAETRGEPIAVIDDHKADLEFVPVRKLPSFLLKHEHARVLCDGVYPQEMAS